MTVSYEHDLTYLTYALSLPVEPRPQTTSLDLCLVAPSGT